MLVNRIWHERAEFTLRCGDCGSLFKAYKEGLFTLRFEGEEGPAYLPICPACYDARKATGRLCGPMVYPAVVDLVQGKPRLIFDYAEVT